MNDPKYLQNLHTHSTFCDGIDTPEEMVLAAIEKGFDTLGFSIHGYNIHNAGYDFATWLQVEASYQEEIARLKKNYGEQLAVYCGIELEVQSPLDLSGYDYVIGSAHYLDVDGVIVPMDRPLAAVENVIDQYFGGDGMKYAKKYFETTLKILEYPEVDFVGHFDLVTKHAETKALFDIESKEYQGYALEALEALTERFSLFEINTGAIARGYRKTPYPSPFILKELKKRNCKILITSDCHDKRYLDCYFKEAEELLRSCGFCEKVVLTKNGFEETSL